MNETIGELAALATALCYAGSSTFFSNAAKTYGSLVANRLRLVTAVNLVMLTHWILFGSPLPVHADFQRWLWLGLSGIVGLAIGDAFLLQSYIIIGPRLGVLMLSLAPALAAFLAWAFLGEKLSWIAIIGILITLGGIAWVVLEKKNGNITSDQPSNLDNPVYVKGLLAGLGAATGQAVGVILAKKGLGGDFPALSANLIRMVSATAAFWALTILQGQVRSTLTSLRSQPRGMGYILVGAIIGPLTGVSLSLYAIQHAQVGVASTIIALPPVFLLPVGYFLFKERFGWGAVAGTLVAILGVALLFFF